MKIRYTGRRGLTLEMHGVSGPSRFWEPDVEREYADDEELLFRPLGGQTFKVNAIDHILRAGPEFVDASTGKNPNFSCAQCGEPATDTMFVERTNLDRVDYADKDGNPLCLTHFLVEHPEHIAHHLANSYNQEPVQKAQQLVSQRDADAAKAPTPAPSPAPTPRPVSSPVAAPAAAPVQE